MKLPSPSPLPFCQCHVGSERSCNGVLFIINEFFCNTVMSVYRDRLKLKVVPRLREFMWDCVIHATSSSNLHC